MNELVKKVKIVFIVCLILATSLTYLSIYVPMKDVLKKSELENLSLMAQANKHILEHRLERCKEGSASMSSRTMIRRKALEYKNNLISIDELKDYTNPLYYDGIKALENVIGAYRVVDNQIIAKQGIIDEKRIKDLKKVQSLTCKIEDQDKYQVIVYSPIKENELILGYDIVFYDINPIIEKLNKNHIQSLVLEQKKAQVLLNNKDTSLSENFSLITDGNYTGFISKLASTDKYIYTKMNNDILFRPIQRVLRITFIGFAISILFFIFLTNWLIVKNAKKLLSRAEKGQEEYKEYALKDPLTGVYSRWFFEQWINSEVDKQEHEKSLYTFIMIDVDNFKSINDKNGHTIGDKVLQKIAEILKSSVRDGDFVIRYGGDEFLLILNKCCKNFANDIVQRIQTNIHNLDDFKFKVDISFGIQELKNKNEIFEVLRLADLKMYECKKRNKGN
ncbi:GGDEF domain-containing protein [Desulfonispora thiosulfatigenes]|nr:GGDEF domain-containing protein [Desulfonispora thiosulfatigenes]